MEQPARRRLRALKAHLLQPPAPAAGPRSTAAAAGPRVTPLVDHGDGHHLGARVEGLDLAHLSEREWGTVWAAWLRYALLVFPDQHLTPAQEVAFYRRFPHLDTAAPASVRRAPLPEAPDIGLVGNARLEDHFGVSGRIAPTGAGFQGHPVRLLPPPPPFTPATPPL